MVKAIKFSECTAEQKAIMTSNLIKIEDVKQNNFNSIVARCMNLLFLGNGSGIVVMFTYFYTKERDFSKIQYIILGYVLGLILVFVISTGAVFLF